MEILNSHIKWQYKKIIIPKDGDIEDKLNSYGAYGWECFALDITAYGCAAFLKKIDYDAMERGRLENIAKVTGKTIEDIMKKDF